MGFTGKSWLNADLKIRKILEKRLAAGNDDSFYVFNVKDVDAKFEFWSEKFPRVKPFYAMKANHCDFAIETLAKLGTGFDCASRNEIERVLALGVSSDRIIYANPSKPPSHLRFAKQKGVDKMTFDNADELMKIKDIFPDAKLVLRIKFDAKTAFLLVGEKFGCDPGDEAERIDSTVQGYETEPDRNQFLRWIQLAGARSILCRNRNLQETFRFCFID